MANEARRRPQPALGTGPDANACKDGARSYLSSIWWNQYVWPDLGWYFEVLPKDFPTTVERGAFMRRVVFLAGLFVQDDYAQRSRKKDVARGADDDESMRTVSVAVAKRKTAVGVKEGEFGNNGLLCPREGGMPLNLVVAQAKL